MTKGSYTNEITAAGFQSVQVKAARVNKAIRNQQNRLRKTAATMSKINKSKSTNPKIRLLRVKKIRALQVYLRAAITLNQARVKELLRPS